MLYILGGDSGLVDAGMDVDSVKGDVGGGGGCREICYKIL